MQIKSIKLNNYRNYQAEQIDFCDGLNIVVGQNAQGKTNLLEAIYLACLTKSLRTNKDKELIKFEINHARVILDIAQDFGDQTVEINIFDNQKKNIKINDTTVLRVGDLLGTLQAVYFSPDELKLVKESPEYRRRFLDIAISQTNKTYFYTLLRYEKILKQRNKLLKTPLTYAQIEPSLSILTEQLLKEAVKIILTRTDFVQKLKPAIKQTHKYLTNNSEDIEIDYQTIEATTEQIEQSLKKEFERKKDKEWQQRQTLVGPHRDDIKIEIDANGTKIDIRKYGSQGQQRTAALSLKLAKLILVEQEAGEKPILLLDDVLSELDQTRRTRLLKIAKNYQTILTTTEVPKEADGVNIIRIKNGKKEL